MVLSIGLSCHADTTFEKRVSANNDDAEQRISTGAMNLSSTDLELAVDGTTSDQVGMRFTAVTIPKSATITNAYIQFKTDETSSAAVSLTIRGQAADNAAGFTSTGYDISSRTTTTASVAWSPPAWNIVGEAGVNQRTPNMTSIIQEIVNRSGWSSGNSLVIIVTGTGKRTAESHNGDSAGAPLLHVEYTISAQWKLDESSGTTAADATGFGNTGTVIGTASWVSAIRNNGFSLNGSTYIQATGLIGTPTNVSLAAWANLTAADTSGAEIISLGDRFGLRLDEGSVSKAFFWNGSSYESVSIGQIFVGQGWHHFAATFNDATDSFKLYVDGVQVASLTTTSSVSYSGGGSNTRIGSHGNGSTSYDFTGVVDDVRVYGYALSAVEVAQLYGFIGHWKLNETSGTTAADSTFFAQNGTVTGGASWATDSAGNGVFDFNGSSQYISITNASHLQPTQSLSIAGWVKGDSWGSGSEVDIVLRKGEGNPNNYQLAIADGKVALYLDDSDANGTRSTTVLSAGRWYHVVGTWDGSTVKIYVDGKLETSAVRTGTIATDTRPVYIGGRSGTDLFDGMQRDIRLYNRAILASEVAELYGLIGHWKFDEAAGTVAADSSGKGNNATINGAAAWTSDCTGNTALSFDGVNDTATTNSNFTPPATGAVAFWMRASGPTSVQQRLFGINGNWEARLETTGKISFDLGASPFVGNEPFATPVVDELDRWYHVVAMFNDTTDAYAVYINGELTASGTSPVNLVAQSAGILSLGTRTGSSQYWQGALRDFRIYNRAIFTSEIASLSGVIARWQLNELSGTVATDSSVAANNATYVGSPTLGVNGSNTTTNGTAVEFNGTSQSMTAGASLLNGLTKFSLSTWVRPDNIAPDKSFLGQNGLIELGIDTATGQIDLWTSNGGSLSATALLPIAKWSHVVAVGDGVSLRIYVNGVEVGSGGSATANYGSNAGTFKIGEGVLAPSGDYFDGRFDDVRVYSRAMCPEEINAIYQGGRPTGVRIINWVETR